MDHIFSPWRYQYITAGTTGTECIFCDIASSSHDEANFVIHRAQHNYVVLNRFPYSSGHVMVVPYRHSPSLAEVPPETSAEMMSLVRGAELRLRQVYRPDGLNIGMNLGSSAGAGVAGHIHMHVLPRWSGDVNFMTTIAETRVIPEDLADSYRKLKDACAPW